MKFERSKEAYFPYLGNKTANCLFLLPFETAFPVGFGHNTNNAQNPLDRQFQKGSFIGSFIGSFKRQ